MKGPHERSGEKEGEQEAAAAVVLEAEECSDSDSDFDLETEEAPPGRGGPGLSPCLGGSTIGSGGRWAGIELGRGPLSSRVHTLVGARCPHPPQSLTTGSH